LPVLAQEIMPPTTPWSGKSLELIANPTNPWITPAESSDLTESPDYTESMAWLKKLSQASFSINRIGTREQGRMISVIIASSDQDFSASELSRSKKPSLFQKAIHPNFELFMSNRIAFLRSSCFKLLQGFAIIL
jgi:hypothetical protein